MLNIDKKELFKLLEYDPHPDVWKFHNSPKRLRIVHAPRQSSKSWSSSKETIADSKHGLLVPGTKWWVVGPSYFLATREFRYIVNDFVQKLGVSTRDMPVYRDSPDSGSLRMVLPWGSEVVGKTCERPSSLQSETLNGVLMSETAQISDGQIWHRFLRQTLDVKQGKAIFPTTPDIDAVWLREMCEDALSNPNGEIGVFNWPVTANPTYPQEAYDQALATYGYDHPYFQEQYLGQWVFYTGRVYKEFQRETHVIEPFDIPKEWRRIRAIDFGHRDPFVCTWMAIGPDDEIYLYDEYYLAGESTRTHADNVKAKSGNDQFYMTVADPSARQLIADLSGYSIVCSGANNDRKRGRLQVTDYLLPHQGFKPQIGFSIEHWEKQERGYPKFFVFSNCTETQREFMFLRWAEKKEMEGLKEKTIGDDHALDTVRYGLMGRPAAFKTKITTNYMSAEWIHKQHQLAKWGSLQIRPGRRSRIEGTVI